MTSRRSVLWLLLPLFTLFQTSREETISEIYGDELLAQMVFYESGPFGSTRGGAWFTDFWQSLDGRVIKPGHWPDTINVRAGVRIDSIQLFYGPYRGGFFGGEGGTLHKVRLYNGDRINRVEGRRGVGPGAGVDQLTFFSNSGRQYGPFGGSGGFHFEAAPPKDDCYLAWISGRSDLRLDSITFHWRCPTLLSVRKPSFEDVAATAGAAADNQGIVSWLLLALGFLQQLLLRRTSSGSATL